MPDAAEEEKACFVIGPIGAEGSPEREAADNILKYIIRPSIKPHGYKAVRADEISEPGMVTRQVMRMVIESPLVVADLTGRNPNVYYELAVRHAIRAPLVQIINGKPPLPFDVYDTRTIFFDLTNIASVEQAKADLGTWVEVLNGDSPPAVENPIAEALDLESYRSSGNPEQEAFGQILAALSDLRADMRLVQTAVVPASIRTWLPILDALDPDSPTEERTRRLIRSHITTAWDQTVTDRAQGHMKGILWNSDPETRPTTDDDDDEGAAGSLTPA